MGPMTKTEVLHGGMVRSGVMVGGLARSSVLGAAVGVLLFFVLLVMPAVGFAAVAWSVRGAAQPTQFLPAGGNRYQLIVANTGSDPSGEVTLTDRLPEGLTLTSFESKEGREEGKWACSETAVSTVTCTLAESLSMGQYAPSLAISVSEPSASPGPLVNTVTVSGGGASVPASTSQSTLVGTGLPSFGITQFSVEAQNVSGEPEQRAGAHPWQVTTSLAFPWLHSPENPLFELIFQQLENVKTIAVELPAGMVGNVLSTEQCTQVQLMQGSCPPGSRVGTIAIAAGLFVRADYQTTTRGNPSAVYNIFSEPGYPAVFGFTFAQQTVYLYGTVVHSPTGERVRLTTVGIPTQLETGDVMLTLWGEPGVFDENGSSAALITNPTECSTKPLMARVEVATWAHPEKTYSQETPVFQHLTGCQGLQESFEPGLSFSPLLGSEGTTRADSPSGYAGTLKVPQDKGAFTEAQTPEVRDATVALPAGTLIDPAAGQGLVGCQERGPEGINLGTGQIGQWGADEGNPEATELGAGHAGGNNSPYDDAEYHTAPGHCPEASTIGSVEGFTPLLENRCGEPGQAACKEGESPAPLQGHVYIAQPRCGGAGQPACTGADAENGNLFGAYVEVAGNGLLIKLPATLSANQATGQLTLRVLEMPELPFSELKVRVHGGPRAPLATSQTCGSQTTTSALTPWSGGPDATPSSSLFSVDWDGAGGPCPATDPFNPGFTGGTVSSGAGAFSPLTLTLTRQDREQDLSDLSVTLPPGVLAKLAGVEKCPDAVAATGACPAGSKIGVLTVTAGPGWTPLVLHGDLYLTGGYKGGAFGEAAVIHAQAGPLNLGDVVVRGAIQVNPVTAQATIVSDPFPQIIDGIPARLRSVNVLVDRPGFTLNPTNCSQLQLTGTVSAQQGAVVNESVPFAAVNCAILKFAPEFKVSTSGKTSKQNGASLVAQLSYPSGSLGTQANIKSVKVALPKSLPSRLATLQKACTAIQFEWNPANCPSGSKIGFATVHTPLLPVPLTGPAIFVSHGGEAFPSLTMVLQGYGVTVDLVGTTFISKKGITSTTFKTAPDVPFNTFELTLPQGQFSALAANGNLCTQKLIIPTEFVAQNGAELKQSTPVEVTGCKPAITVTSHAVKGRTATLAVSVPSAGELVASAKGLSRGSARSSRASTLTVRLTLSKAEQAFLKKHHANRLKARIELTFTPKKGSKLKTAITVFIG